DRADRAINHPIDPHFAVVVYIALEKDPIAGNSLALDRLGHGEMEPVPGKRKPNGAALLDVSQRPAGIIKVCEPGWAAPSLSNQALVGLPWDQARCDTPPFSLDNFHVVFVLQIQRNSGHSILSSCRGDAHGY